MYAPAAKVETKCKGSMNLVSSHGGGTTDYLYLPSGSHTTVLNIETGRQEVSLVGHYSSVYCLAWSRHGQL